MKATATKDVETSTESLPKKRKMDKPVPELELIQPLELPMTPANSMVTNESPKMSPTPTKTLAMMEAKLESVQEEECNEVKVLEP